MAERLEAPAAESPYRQRARFSALYANAAKSPIPPSVVAAKILEIADSGSWQLRHPASPDAAGFLEWRKTMTDEEWIDLNAGDDATFFVRLGESSKTRLAGFYRPPGARNIWRCFNLKLTQERFLRNLPFNSIRFATLEIEVRSGQGDLLKSQGGSL